MFNDVVFVLICVLILKCCTARRTEKALKVHDYLQIKLRIFKLSLISHVNYNLIEVVYVYVRFF